VPLASALVLVLPGAPERLQLERGSLGHGELWRLVGGHLAHHSFEHWLLDALAFAGLALACERRAPGRTRLALAAAALAIPLAVLRLQPELETYRGLSGLVSALFGLVLALEGRDGARGARIAGGLFLLKLAYELATGRALFLDSRGLGFTPVPLAHALGALLGLGLGLGARRSSAPERPARIPTGSALPARGRAG
jgi:rhomboid family GlyGly-CTERM serine protease